jgi:hypothetical protein
MFKGEYTYNKTNEILSIGIEEFARLPVIKATWSPNYQDYDIWLSARERGTLLWIFECQHGRILLVGSKATVHPWWKRNWRQGVIKLPKEHKDCNSKIYTKFRLEDDYLRYFKQNTEYEGKNLLGNMYIYLTAKHDKFVTGLSIRLTDKSAEVRFTFPHIVISEPFIFASKIDYQKAIEIFKDLYRKNLLVEKPFEPTMYAHYIPPHEIMFFIENEF